MSDPGPRSVPAYTVSASIQSTLDLANGEDSLAIRLGHSYGRVSSGEAKTKLTIEPAKAATL